MVRRSSIWLRAGASSARYATLVLLVAAASTSWARGKIIDFKRLPQTDPGLVEFLAKSKDQPWRIAASMVLDTHLREKGREINLPTFGSGVSAKELAIFTRQFSVMIDAGLPLVQCLEILASQQENKTFQKVLTNTRSGRVRSSRHAHAPPSPSHNNNSPSARMPLSRSHATSSASVLSMCDTSRAVQSRSISEFRVTQGSPARYCHASEP